VFLCGKENPTSDRRQAMTKQLDKWLIECARNLNDGKLMAGLSGDDVVAQELKYHYFCLTALYNKERAYLLTNENQDDSKLSREREVYALVFSELFTCILGIKTSSDNPVVFRLTDIVSLSKQRFEQVGMKTHDAKAICDKVQKLYTVIKDIGNPFMVETGGLFTLDTKIIAHPSVAEMVASHYDNGKTRFNEFLKGLDTDECSFYQPSQISFSKSQNQTRVIQSKKH
jgi:hypothetical protein